MPVTPDQIRAAADAYVAGLAAGDLEAIMALYADTATVEDPVGGGTVHDGAAAIRAFYETVTALKCDVELGDVRVCGDELLFNFRITTHFDENTKATVDVWDLMAFDEDGKVTSMKAYWGAENMS